jgi:hypothetical protein
VPAAGQGLPDRLGIQRKKGIQRKNYPCDNGTLESKPDRIDNVTISMLVTFLNDHRHNVDRFINVVDADDCIGYVVPRIRNGSCCVAMPWWVHARLCPNLHTEGR